MLQLVKTHIRTHTQAARVTSEAQKLISTGPQIRSRPLQYVKSPQIELDSFVGLTQAVRLRVSGQYMLTFRFIAAMELNL